MPVALDLKIDDIKRVLKLVSKADALIEGSGPVMERLGLGPEVCLELTLN